MLINACMHHGARGLYTYKSKILLSCVTQERTRALDATTRASLQSTQRKANNLASTGRYIDPVTRQAQFTESMRALKASQGMDVKELEAQWGEDGARAMQDIMRMKKPEQRRRVRATPDDLSAVKALDQFEDPSPPPAEDEEGVDEGSTKLGSS